MECTQTLPTFQSLLCHQVKGRYFTDKFLTSCVIAPSSAPQNVTNGSISSTSISIQWDQVPCIEQNSEIIGYMVMYNSSSGDMQMDPVQNSQMFNASGLTPDTTYSFQVAAVNSDDEEGRGPYSSPLEIVTSKHRDESH